MALLNYTTKIEPEQTIGEIQRMLSKYNIEAMMTEYDGRNVAAVSFKLNINGKRMSFKLPCNWRAVYEVLKNDPKVRSRMTVTEEQAIRVAWRVVKDWIEAQLAVVEIGMVSIPTVFLPYMMVGKNQTLAEKISEDPTFLLGNGE